MGRRDLPIRANDQSPSAQMRRARQAAGIPLTLMATRTKLTKGYLSTVENGHQQPSAGVLNAYAEITGLDTRKVLVKRAHLLQMQSCLNELQSIITEMLAESSQ